MRERGYTFNNKELLMEKESTTFNANVKCLSLSCGQLCFKYLQLLVIFALTFFSLMQDSGAEDKIQKSREFILNGKIVSPHNDPKTHEEVCLQFVNGKGDLILKVKKYPNGEWNLKGDCGNTDTEGNIKIKSQIDPDIISKYNDRDCIKFILTMGPIMTVKDKNTNKSLVLIKYLDEDDIAEFSLGTIVAY